MELAHVSGRYRELLRPLTAADFVRTRHRGRTGKVIVRGIGKAREQRAPVTHAHHLPEVVAIDEIAVLVDRLGLEHEGAGVDEVVVLDMAGFEDRVPVVRPLDGLMFGHAVQRGKTIRGVRVERARRTVACEVGPRKHDVRRVLECRVGADAERREGGALVAPRKPAVNGRL